MKTFSALLAPCAGNSTVIGEFPLQRPMRWSFDVLFDLRLNKRLSKQSWNWAPSQYPKRRLFVRSREVSKPRDWYFKLSYRFEIWQAHRQHCCRSACQISERSDNSKYKSRGFETLRDLTERRLFGYWDGNLVIWDAIAPIMTSPKWRNGNKPRLMWEA